MAIRAALFALWAPIIASGPYLVVGMHRFMPRLVQNLLFIWPQAAFPANTYHGAPPHIRARLWAGWWVLYWTAVVLAFAIVTRRLRPAWSFVLAGVTAFGFTVLLQAVIGAFGLYFQFDAL